MSKWHLSISLVSVTILSVLLPLFSVCFSLDMGWGTIEDDKRLGRDRLSSAPTPSLPHYPFAFVFAGLKAGFHMPRKSQTIGDFTVSRPSQILLIYRQNMESESSSSTMTDAISIFEEGGWSQAIISYVD